MDAGGYAGQKRQAVSVITRWWTLGRWWTFFTYAIQKTSHMGVGSKRPKRLNVHQTKVVLGLLFVFSRGRIKYFHLRPGSVYFLKTLHNALYKSYLWQRGILRLSVLQQVNDSGLTGERASIYGQIHRQKGHERAVA